MYMGRNHTHARGGDLSFIYGLDKVASSDGGIAISKSDHISVAPRLPSLSRPSYKFYLSLNFSYRGASTLG